MSIVELFARAEQADGSLVLTVPETWLQGRTTFGGFSAALMLAAASRAGGEGLPPLRSAQFALIAPVMGEVTASAQVLRRGRNATWIEARIACGGNIAITASFVFMGPVDSKLHVHDSPAPEGLVPVETARAVTFKPPTPAFVVNHFESRYARPPVPQPRAEVCHWIRPMDWQTLDPMMALLLTGDAVPPGVMPLLTAAVPVSTMHWQVNLLTPAPVTRDGWWLVRSVGDYAEKGCTSQRIGLWNADGEAVVAEMQSVALFG